MQRLLETNCNTDPGSPWSIRFTWEPNFWTKQLASLGEPGPTLWAFTYLLRMNIKCLLSLLGRAAFMPKRKHALRLPEVVESFSKPFLGVELRYE